MIRISSPDQKSIIEQMVFDLLRSDHKVLLDSLPEEISTGIVQDVTQAAIEVYTNVLDNEQLTPSEQVAVLVATIAGQMIDNILLNNSSKESQ